MCTLDCQCAECCTPVIDVVHSNVSASMIFLCIVVYVVCCVHHKLEQVICRADNNSDNTRAQVCIEVSFWLYIGKVALDTRVYSVHLVRLLLTLIRVHKC